LVRDGLDPMIIRLVLMAHHYRADWEWSEAELDRAAERLRAYRSAAARGGHHPATVEALRAALRQDLDTPAALETLDAWASGRGGRRPVRHRPVRPGGAEQHRGVMSPAGGRRPGSRPARGGRGTALSRCPDGAAGTARTPWRSRRRWPRGAPRRPEPAPGAARIRRRPRPCGPARPRPAPRPRPPRPAPRRGSVH